MRLCFIAFAVVGCLAGAASAKERTEHFDQDPGWEAKNNRSPTAKKRTVRQDFGYSRTAHAGGKAGEIGGFITAAAETAYYARKIDVKSFDDSLSASGRFVCRSRQFHVLIGYFNADTVNEWRTPNSIAIRLLGRGDRFFAYVEYATSKWRAGGDSPGGFATVKDPKSGKAGLRGFRTGEVYEWTLRYDPAGHGGSGAITVTIGNETAVCHLDAGHKNDGARFNRFGLMPVLKSADDGGEVWLDDITIDGMTDHFDEDPKWEGVNNRREYTTANIRPRFDFGYCETQFAGGVKSGELGGLVFRGDCRKADRLAAYGDRLASLNLQKPLRASGRIALRRAVSDSTTLLGFYHSEESLRVNPSQSSGFPRSFLGVAVEGPSREGFFLYPVYRNNGDGQGYAGGADRPRVLPDGKSHEWSLVYDPAGADGRGRITVKMEGKSAVLDLGAGHRTDSTRFDRFGIVTTWIDGNGQQLYFDDLTYTFEQ